MHVVFEARDLIWLRLSLHKGDSVIIYVIDKKDPERKEHELLMEYAVINDLFKYFKNAEPIELAIADWLSDPKNTNIVDISDHVVRDDFFITTDELPIHHEGQKLKSVFRVKEILEEPF